MIKCESSSMVELLPSKQIVVGSNPIFRSKRLKPLFLHYLCHKYHGRESIDFSKNMLKLLLFGFIALLTFTIGVVIGKQLERSRLKNAMASNMVNRLVEMKDLAPEQVTRLIDKYLFP